MQVIKPQNYNIAQNRAYTSNFKQIAPSTSAYQPQFTGFATVAKEVANSAAPKAQGWYDKLTEWIAKNYYARFYNSKAAKFIVDHTKSPKWNNMTTHMSALGSTLISGMYVMRTLQNDKLDPEKRKTLAINDGLTWVLSTAGAYLLDSKLGNLCDKATTRFAANYLLDNPEARRTDLFGEWNPKDLKQMMSEWYKHIKPESEEGAKLVKDLGEKAYKNIREFNLDILKNKKLTTQIDGIGVLKSLFVFGMVYRYIVPVIVMKPANYIGRKIHEKNAQQEQVDQTKKA